MNKKQPKQVEQTTILALDAASHKTGYSIYKRGEIISSGTWVLNRKDPIYDLYKHIEETIANYDIDKIVAEEMYIDETKTKATWRKLAQVHGAIHLTACLCGLSVPEKIEPLEAKRYMGVRLKNYGRNKSTSREFQKQSMINHVRLLGYKLENVEADDEADAIGIMLTYLNKINLPIKHPNEEA